MFKKNGEVKVYKTGKEVSPKVADENSERYTIDDLVKEEDIKVFKKLIKEAEKDPDFSIEVNSSEEK